MRIVCINSGIHYFTNKITWSLKVDQYTKMGIVTEVKQELRKVNALKLSYTASKEVKD